MSTITELPTTRTVGIAVIRRSNGETFTCDPDFWAVDSTGRFAAEAAPWRVDLDRVLDFTPCKPSDACPDDCETEMACETCDHPICPDHDDNVVTCFQAEFHCDDGCRDRCTPCVRETSGDER
ncbi:MAG: hypothetical protein JWP31_1805 [Aeromicrobium sp.]|nr:hypothetical protein [Aeromicrobium sp.]